jgi:DNA-binding response OmpR family regulator
VRNFYKQAIKDKGGRKRMRILLVEDDSYLVRMYQKVLELEGFEVVVAQDGETGTKLAETDKPDLVLLDIMLPKMSGYQVLDALRSKETTKHLPVIVLTNLASSEDINLATAKGANRVVVKSQNDPMQVAGIVKEYLAQMGKTAN